MTLFLPPGQHVHRAMGLRSKKDLTKYCSIQLELNKGFIGFDEDLVILWLESRESWNNSDKVTFVVHTGDKMSPEDLDILDKSFLARSEISLSSLSLESIVAHLVIDVLRSIPNGREGYSIERPYAAFASPSATFTIRALGEDEDLPAEAAQMQQLLQIQDANRIRPASQHYFIPSHSVLVTRAVRELMESLFDYKYLTSGLGATNVNLQILNLFEYEASNKQGIDKEKLSRAAEQILELPMDRMYFLLKKYIKPYLTKWENGRKKSEKFTHAGIAKLNNLSLETFCYKGKLLASFAASHLLWLSDKPCPKDLQEYLKLLPPGQLVVKTSVAMSSNAEGDEVLDEIKRVVVSQSHQSLKDYLAGITSSDVLAEALDLRDKFDTIQKDTLTEACNKFVSSFLAGAHVSLSDPNRKKILDLLLRQGL